MQQQPSQQLNQLEIHSVNQSNMLKQQLPNAVTLPQIVPSISNIPNIPSIPPLNPLDTNNNNISLPPITHIHQTQLPQLNIAPTYQQQQPQPQPQQQQQQQPPNQSLETPNITPSQSVSQQSPQRKSSTYLAPSYTNTIPHQQQQQYPNQQYTIAYQQYPYQTIPNYQIYQQQPQQLSQQQQIHQQQLHQQQQLQQQQQQQQLQQPQQQLQQPQQQLHQVQQQQQQQLAQQQLAQQQYQQQLVQQQQQQQQQHQHQQLAHQQHQHQHQHHETQTYPQQRNSSVSAKSSLANPQHVLLPKIPATSNQNVAVRRASNSRNSVSHELRKIEKPKLNSPIPRNLSNASNTSFASNNTNNQHSNTLTVNKLSKTQQLIEVIDRLEYISNLNENLNKFLNFINTNVHLLNELSTVLKNSNSISEFENHNTNSNGNNNNNENSPVPQLNNPRLQEFYKLLTNFPPQELDNLNHIIHNYIHVISDWKNILPTSNQSSQPTNLSPTSNFIDQNDVDYPKVPGESVLLKVVPFKPVENQTHLVQFNSQGTLQPDLSVTLKLACQHCGSTSTPEWRKGPEDARTLCNACGLFHTKLVKKIGPESARIELKKRRDNGDSKNRRI